MGKPSKQFTLNTKEIALISIFSSIWIISQIYLGPLIGGVTGVHGVMNRLVGWLLMILLAELTGRFGRVSIMATVAALATRIVRTSASLYALTVGLGYALAGLIFDILFFLPPMNRLGGAARRVYLLGDSLVSGVVALVPYLIYKLVGLGLYGFLALTPVYAYDLAKGTLLSVLGTLIGLFLLPQIEGWKPRIRS